MSIIFELGSSGYIFMGPFLVSFELQMKEFGIFDLSRTVRKKSPLGSNFPGLEISTQVNMRIVAIKAVFSQSVHGFTLPLRTVTASITRGWDEHIHFFMV